MKIVSALWVLPFNHVDAIQNGAIAVEEDKIAAVGNLADLLARYPNATHQSFPGSVILPGLVNAHCHLDRAGFYERYTVETESGLSPVAWLLEGLHYLSRTPSATVARKMEQNLAQFLQTGITCAGVMTHYEGTFPLMKASPIRGVVFQEILSGPDKQAQQRFEVALALIEQYKDAKPGHLQMGLGPYAAYLLSKNLLNIISGHAKDGKLPLQIHAAESFAEMEFFYESSGPIATHLFPAIGWEELPPPHRKTPIQHLDEIGFFTTPFSLVGGYHLSSADFPRLSRGLARVVYCPSGNRRFKLGQFPLKQLQEQGIPIALGTEIATTSHGLDLWEEMRLALRDGSHPLPTPLELLKMATLGGAYALGYENQIGSLDVGKQADYIVVEMASPHAASVADLCQSLISQTQPSSIKQVSIAGQVLPSLSS